ncbi:MAG: FkbM family methyltransferase [Rhizobiales bacterium]|nr:FkbM family methyltransferase [Hyphomicrobiales bacterium]
MIVNKFRALLSRATGIPITVTSKAFDTPLKFRVNCRDNVSRHIAKYGGYELRLTKHLRDLVRTTDTSGLFIDIGANVGWYSLNFAKLKQIDRVVAFEPDLKNYTSLIKNIDLNADEKIVALPFAVGDKSSFASLYRYKVSNQGHNSLLEDYGLGSRQVPVFPLDKVLELLEFQDKPVKAIKIDVEGYEVPVLDGASRTLAKAEIVQTELSPGLLEKNGNNTGDILKRMKKFGFMPNQMAPDGKLQRVSDATIRDAVVQTDIIWTRD